jgi:hypothetical protein
MKPRSNNLLRILTSARNLGEREVGVVCPFLLQRRERRFCSEPLLEVRARDSGLGKTNLSI